MKPKVKTMDGNLIEKQNDNSINTSLLGTVHSKTVTLNVKILELDKEVPSEELDNFIEWLKHKAIEVGTGKQKEYYGYTENFRDDIGVLFNVYCA